jgi:hypothetical protein
MIILHQSFSYFFILLSLSFAVETVQGSETDILTLFRNGAFAPFSNRNFILYQRNSTNPKIIKDVPNEIAARIYDHCDIRQSINFARSCKAAYDIWILKQKNNPFYYIPLLTDSFNDQAYAQTITRDYDKEQKIALSLDQDSWIFNQENGNFFVLGSTFYNPYDQWEPKLITPATKVTKSFGALLCGNYDQKTNSITFSNRYDFHNYAHNKDDRMYYTVNKDRTKILLAGWKHCPRYINDGMSEIKDVRLIHVNQHQIFEYRMHPYLEQLNYTAVEFVDTNGGQENINIYGKNRENGSNVMIFLQKLEDGTPTANITGMVAGPHQMAVYEVLDCKERKYLPLNEDGTDCKNFDVQFTNNLITTNDRNSQQTLPLNEKETVSVQEILTLHQKGKIKTEGMEQFIQFLNDPQRNKTPENKTPENKLSRSFSWRNIALFTGISAGAAILIWVTFKKELLHRFNLLTA